MGAQINAKCQFDTNIIIYYKTAKNALVGAEIRSMQRPTVKSQSTANEYYLLYVHTYIYIYIYIYILPYTGISQRRRLFRNSYHINSFFFKSLRQNQCCIGFISALAALAPERATAGMPIPGKTPSPHRTKLENGVDPSER